MGAAGTGDDAMASLKKTLLHNKKVLINTIRDYMILQHFYINHAELEPSLIGIRLNGENLCCLFLRENYCSVV